jgi:murein DD-endopeptidase MepM/ murein hydrolase activator NlpD
VQNRATDWITNAPSHLRSLASKVRLTDKANLFGRGKVALVASVALVGTGLAGTVTSSVYTAAHHDPAKTYTVSAERTASERADRSTRTGHSKSTQSAAEKAAAAKAAAAKAAAAKSAAAKAAAAKAAAAKAAAAKAAAPKPAWVAPMAKYQLTSCYGPRWGTEHQGIDFAEPENGQELAAAAGTVIMAGWNDGGYGNFVVIDHGNSTYTLYGHANKVLVSAGQHVVAGQPISLEGSTGDSTGPHLHFEVWNGMWSRIEPASFLRAHGVSLPGC